MGMYTKFHLDIFLCDPAHSPDDDGTPKEILDVIRHMVAPAYQQDSQGNFTPKPKYPALKIPAIFKDCKCWENMFLYGGLTPDLQFDDPEYCAPINLKVYCEFKNYHDEIFKFLKFIEPWVKSYDDRYLGFYMYEDDTYPTLK